MEISYMFEEQPYTFNHSHTLDHPFHTTTSIASITQTIYKAL